MFMKNRMTYSAKSSRLVKKSETSNFLMTHNFDDIVINGDIE